MNNDEVKRDINNEEVNNSNKEVISSDNINHENINSREDLNNNMRGNLNNTSGESEEFASSNLGDNVSSEDLSHTVVQDENFDTIPDMEIPKQNNENSNSNNKSSSKVKKSKKRSPMVGIVAASLICAILGGGIGSVATYGAMQGKINEAIEEAQKKNPTGSSDLNISSISSITIPEVVDKVASSVVGVSTTSVATDVFGFNMKEQQGIGSGVIFREDGYVLTNYHVVENANQVKVIFSTGQEVAAKVVNYDEDADLAVVKITEDVPMPGVAELGDSDKLKVGEDVIAIGNPLGKEYLGSVTNGIISAVNRDVDLNDNGIKTNLIQTNAAINPGNSGGPLINASGQVIGINTAKIQATGVEGIGFAIPINDAIDKLDVLVKQKIILGISVINVTEDLSKQYNLPEGIYIRNVEDFSIAQKGGLQPGDVITKFGGKKVKTVDELNEIKNQFGDGDTMPVEFVRKGQTMTANLIAE